MNRETTNTQSHPGLALSKNTLISRCRRLSPGQPRRLMNVFRCQQEISTSLFKTLLTICFTIWKIEIKNWTVALESSSHIIQLDNHCLNNIPYKFLRHFSPIALNITSDITSDICSKGLKIKSNCNVLGIAFIAFLRDSSHLFRECF